MIRRGLPRLVALALAFVVIGCGSDDEPAVERSSFEQRIEERLDADPDQAACITDYVYEDYDTAAVRAIHEDGITALPQGLWDPYFYSLIGCLNPGAAVGP